MNQKLFENINFSYIEIHYFQIYKYTTLKYDISSLVLRLLLKKMATF